MINCCFVLLVVVATGSLPVISQAATKFPEFPLYINAGSREDTTGSSLNDGVVVWKADEYFEGGVYHNPGRCDIMEEDGLVWLQNNQQYCTTRSFHPSTPATPNTYIIPVPANHAYEVTLYFTEPYYNKAGGRVFDIFAEGHMMFEDLDIFVAAGGRNLPFQLSFTVTTDDAFLELELVRKTFSPIISAIEIQAPVHESIRVNAGGNTSFTDTNGDVWLADRYFMGRGRNYSIGNDAAIANTDIDSLYTSERYFKEEPTALAYDIPVTHAGKYAVRLHFAEIYFSAPGLRSFDIWVEGSLVQAGLDLIERVGFQTALILEATPTVLDGAISIALLPAIENPKISGIEIFDMRNYQAQTTAPTASPDSKKAFKPILINCGGSVYEEVSGERVWMADAYFNGGSDIVASIDDVTDTVDDELYQSQRHGEFSYEIPVDLGNYEVILHFAELHFSNPGERLFDIAIEGASFEGVDLVSLAGGANMMALSLEAAETVSDGYLSITLTSASPAAGVPTLSAIEIQLVASHLAHAVTGGPYFVVDTNDSGSAWVVVDGAQSHTHGTGLHLVSWTWKENADVLSEKVKSWIKLDVGEHTITLTIEDSGGNVATDTTTVSILPYGYPALSKLSHSSGSIGGGNSIIITGSGFTYSAADTVVHFGVVELSGTDIEIVNQSTIIVVVPPTSIAAPALVSVETPLFKSNAKPYVYLSGASIDFGSGLLMAYDSPTVVRFGPDGCLYVGNIDGYIGKLTLNDDFTGVDTEVMSHVSEGRAILGIAFDPMDTSPNPQVYIATSSFFHGDSDSSSGAAVNGAIQVVSGAALDVVHPIITGLPVSDHDHGINAIEFGDDGELYIQIGGNTNGGVPGHISSSLLQKESYYSAATLVAYLADPLFDGSITYDADDDGSPNGGYGIEVFAPGNRNPFGIVLHSNGHLFGTDNGPNIGYGDMKTDCQAGKQIPDQNEPDKINLLVGGAYYGHPNPKRADVDNDPRQCVWRSIGETSDVDYTAPILVMPSSTTGIIEWQSDHFQGQLRGNLITAKYKGGLFRVILDESGTAVAPESDPPIPLFGDKTLDVTQAPDGSLIDTRLVDHSLYYYRPKEPDTLDLVVRSVFPRRGPQAGGTMLSIYGDNFDLGNPAVTIGDKPCPVDAMTATKIKCKLPSHTGTRDVVVVLASGQSYRFKRGYRYITGGRPAAPTVAPTTAGTDNGRWIEVQPDAPIEARHEACFVMVDNPAAGRKAYLVGGRGDRDTEIYDPVTGLWTKGANPPIELHHMQCVAAQGKLWIMSAWTGGYPFERNAGAVHVYDPATNQWSTRTPIEEGRRRGAAAVIVSADETKIYVSHGNDGGHELSNFAVSLGYLDEYDIASDSWTALSDDAPNPRDHTGGAMLNGRICVAGGRNGGEINWPDVAPTDCYNLATSEWEVEAPIPQVRSGSSYGTTCDGKLMVAGGEGGGKEWDNVDVFDGTSWTTVDNLVRGRHGSGLAVDCVCNQIHIASGSGGQGAHPEITSLETYFPGGLVAFCTE